MLLSLCLALTGCASILVPDSTPLTQAQINPLGAPTISRGGYRYESLTSARDMDDWLILVALSGVLDWPGPDGGCLASPGGRLGGVAGAGGSLSSPVPARNRVT